MSKREKTQATGCWRTAGIGLALLSLLPGCGHMSHTDRGALGGAAIGAGAGALIGAATGNPEAGAVLGAGAGAITGAVTGSAIDQAEYRAERDVAIAQAQAQANQAHAARGPLGLEEIAQMAHSGAGDRVIIDQIRLTGVQYNLSADQITWLKNQAVSDSVISAMQATGYGATPVARAPRVIVEEPAPVVIHRHPRPVYIRRPSCYVPYRRPRFGFSFIHHGGCR